MSPSAVLVWLRNDLRLYDNPALVAAAESGLAVVPVFLWSPEEECPWPPGSASRWWLHQSLESLGQALDTLGLHLIVRRGPFVPALMKLAGEVRARSVFWNRCYEPHAVARDQAVQESLWMEGFEVRSFPGHLLYEPWTLANRVGQPYRVFTPFWKACLAAPWPAEPLPRLTSPHAPAQWPESIPMAALELLPATDWARGFRENWKPGEPHAREALDRFMQEALAGYQELRDQPGASGTSRLSPYLHFGEISPREVWHRIRAGFSETTAGPYLRQLIWREFAHHLLFHFPDTVTQPLHQEFARFPWREDDVAFRSWSRGQTGYPLVDAGMRELWHTGWMHNRVRMIVASFLVKHLLIPWQQGAGWFWDTLVDADLANNTFGWQWSVGCGADAAPYFRIFNPVLQGEKFDPEGDYVRAWVPEITRLPDRWIHRPWQAPATVLTQAGVSLGRTYPRPLIDHPFARTRALNAYQTMRTDVGMGFEPQG